ncbi:hypothetical protein DPMN_130162 [Dreissena polymorpha]|uniref:Uncharacterized protein n=1 Tax=Dreissena polymorpha TaxID=45954 RepID=A0A9D4H655_DREPO|nr:hypothetical protein DPMN_130162 [Dreissena polymorpha]
MRQYKSIISAYTGKAETSQMTDIGLESSCIPETRDHVSPTCCRTTSSLSAPKLAGIGI